MENNQTFLYTEEQLMARLKFFIGICLALTLTGIVFVVLYSLIFVTQPLNAISPIDQKFFELIVPIATFLTGTLSGIMLAGRSKEEVDATLAMMKQANENVKTAKTPSTSSTPTIGQRVDQQLQTNGYYDQPAQPQVILINGKPAPQPAPQPEI